jgi:1-acyl-sn-glycerol-3-phosphate acyltransferase
MTEPHFLKRLLVLLHTVVIIIGTVISTFIFAVLAILVSFFSKNGDGVHQVARVWGRSILWISLVPVDIFGIENIDPRRSAIYMCNHQSNFDIPVLLSKLPVQFRWLAKAELFKIPIFGRGMRGAGYISIDRSNRKSAFKSLTAAARIIREGTSVLVFPEGTRSRDGKLQSFKKGGFVLSVDAGVPVVPLVIRGTHAIMPRNTLLIRRQAVRIDILPPVETGQYSRKTKNDLMNRVYTVMAEAIQTEPEGPTHA